MDRSLLAVFVTSSMKLNRESGKAHRHGLVVHWKESRPPVENPLCQLKAEQRKTWPEIAVLV